MLTSLLLSALTAFIPVGMDTIKGLSNKWLGGAQFQPSNFADYVQLQQLDVEKLKALSQLDAPGGPISPWVANLRASTRYLITWAVILTWVAIELISIKVPVEDAIISDVQIMSNAVMFFLFGDRVYSGMKQGFGK